VATENENTPLRLGNFSVSLAVKDLAASREFYEQLGFRAAFGEPSQNWLILQNETSTIGLFQGMFDKNMLTFNPTDVREIQRALKKQGVSFVTEADETTKGPASAMLIDPDGNPVLLDQHH
jgi:catechol 2,3-dioxygenase-like lactoylglutathione lyase family enzyme